MNDLRNRLVAVLLKAELASFRFDDTDGYPSTKIRTNSEAAVIAADVVIEAISSWDCLMELLDEHYPADVFPTLEDNERRDSGPRIVSLIRHLDAARRAT